MKNESGVLLLADPVPSDTCYCERQRRPVYPATRALTGLYPCSNV